MMIPDRNSIPDGEDIRLVLADGQIGGHTRHRLGIRRSACRTKLIACIQSQSNKLYQFRNIREL
jgi:hypothetical protein